MRKLLIVLGLLLAVAAPAAAQTTIVTMNVKDSAQVPYSNGNYSITLVNNTGQVAYFQGAPLSSSQQQFAGKLDSTGSATLPIPSSNFISSGQGGPVSQTTWNVAITASDGGSGFSASLSITGATNNISTSLNAFAPR